MRVIPDASDFYVKNRKMLANLKILVPITTEKQAQSCVDKIKEFLKLAISGNWGTDGKLEKSIDKQTLQTGNKTIIGIGNTNLMPSYWAIQEHGGTIPPRVPKFAKAMHFFGYGAEWFMQRVKGFTIQAKNYFANGYNYSLIKARWAFSVLLHRIVG